MFSFPNPLGKIVSDMIIPRPKVPDAKKIPDVIIDTYKTAKKIKKVLTPKVEPVIGSVVYCDLAEFAEHSGIYIGNNRIVHLNGDGKVEAVTPKEFIRRLWGLNPAAEIYVSCDSDDEPVGCHIAANRAEERIGTERKYNMLLDNCHQFVSGCLTGNFNNTDNFLMDLKSISKTKLTATNWNIWQI